MSNDIAGADLDPTVTRDNVVSVVMAALQDQLDDLARIAEGHHELLAIQAAQLRRMSALLNIDLETGTYPEPQTDPDHTATPTLPPTRRPAPNQSTAQHSTERADRSHNGRTAGEVH